MALECKVLVYKDDEAKQWSLKRINVMEEGFKDYGDRKNNYDCWYAYTSNHSLGNLYQDAANMVTMNGVYIERGVDCVHLDLPAVNRYVIIIFGKTGLADGPDSDLQLACVDYLEGRSRDELQLFAKRSLISSLKQ